MIRIALRLLAPVLCLVVMSGVAHADRSAGAAIVDLTFGGEVTEGLRDALALKLREGLSATGMKVVSASHLRQVLSQRPGRCNTEECWRLVAGKLECRFLVGGTVVGDDRSYAIKLYLADGASGKVLARVERRCDICGLEAVAEKMGLAASALRAKVKATEHAPAPVSIQASPPGAAVYVDDKLVGTAPVELDLKAGSHTIRVEAEGHLGARRTVTAVSGVEERIEVKLIPVAPRRSYRKVAGWALVGAGAAALGVAIALFVVDGGQTGCSGEDRVPGGQCPEVRETSAGAWTAAILAVGAAATGTYLLVSEPGERAPQAARSGPGALSVRF